MSSDRDNLDKLAKVLHDREAVPKDYLGGSDARILGEAADEIERQAKEIDTLREMKDEKNAELVEAYERIGRLEGALREIAGIERHTKTLDEIRTIARQALEQNTEFNQPSEEDET